MTRKHHQLDEDDVRVRPGKGKSRPRSKDRPEHIDARTGMVVAVDRGRFTVELADGVTMYAVKARELGRKGIVVGDRVDVVGDTSGVIDTQGRIVRRGERETTLRRTADDTDPVERVIVANATRLGIVVAAADPPPRIGLIDRALVAAFDAGIDPLLIVTKTDLGSPGELEAMYRPLDVEMHLVERGHVGDGLRKTLRDEVTVLVGHSGVGKSTLVNGLVDDASARSTGRVNTVTGRGRHTSTSVAALRLPHGGWVIDTPGIRSFGLAHIDVARVFEAFPDLHGLTGECPRACSHDEPDCALNDVEDPGVRLRVESLRRLVRSRNDTPDDDHSD